jgi:hypothetical protein
MRLKRLNITKNAVPQEVDNGSISKRQNILGSNRVVACGTLVVQNQRIRDKSPVHDFKFPSSLTGVTDFSISQLF